MRTITFYSYKGGTGRTLLLANVAKFLAWCGKTVVVLDLDLEAPGLHYKLGMGSTADAGRLTFARGVVDYLLAWQDANDDPGVAVSDYVEENVRRDLDYPGKIHLVPAGRAPSMEYAANLARLSWWQLIYENNAIPWPERLGIRALAKIKEFARANLSADYLLIDSRTGITDVGGVALNILADSVVCTMLSNKENIDGIAQVVKNLAQANAPGRAASVEYLVLLSRCQENIRLQDDHEGSMIERISEELSSAIGAPVDSLPGWLGLEVLHSDRELELIESFRFDGRHTPNESLLLRDYFRTFRLLGLTAGAPSSRAIEIIEGAGGIDGSEGAPNNALDSRESLVAERIARGHVADWPGDPWWVWTHHRITSRKPTALVYLPPTPHRWEKIGRDERFANLESFMSSVATRVGEAIGGKVLTKTAPDFTWDNDVATRMLEGEFELSGEPFFLNWVRSHLVGLVQFGWMRHFSLLVRTTSPLVDQLNPLLEKLAKFSPRGGGRSDREASIVRLARSLLDEKVEFKFGVVGESAASGECVRHLAVLLDDPDSLQRMGTVEELRQWMAREPNVAIGVCDMILADTVAGDNAGEFRYGRIDDRYLLPFFHPVPVGIPYPAGDRGWRRIIAKAMLDVLTDDAERWGSWKSKGNVHEDLRGAGIDPLDASLLHARLSLDLPFSDALRYATVASGETEMVQVGEK